LEAVNKKLSQIVPVLKNHMKNCESCGQCLQNCYLAPQKPKIAKKIMKSIKDYIDSNFKKRLPSMARAAIWRCCTDEYCNQFCPHGISKAVLMISLRFVLLQKGSGPFMLQMGENLLRKGLHKDPKFSLQRVGMRILGHFSYPNKWIKDPKRMQTTRRLELAKHPPLHQIKPGSTLFMPGCGHTYGMPSLVQLTMAILDKAHVNYHTIGTPEFCCGGAFAVAGFLKGSFLIGEHTGNLLAKLKPKRVITACPGCFMAYSTKKIPIGVGNKTFNFPLSTILEDANIEVLHLSEYIIELIKKERIKFHRPINRPVAVIASCSTGRRNETLGKGKITETQQEILKSIPGIDYRELTYIGDKSRCCGITAKLTEKVASLSSIFNPDLAYNSQKTVIEDALSKGVRDVATICGGCVMNYGNGLRQMGTPLNLWDIQELVAYAMGINIYPREHEELLNWMQLSPPFIKLGLFRSIPRLLEASSYALKYLLPS
jgi:heterodisulfide reductase subunit D